MKYIDSEKLIAEIERRKKSIDECPFIEAELGASIKRDAKIKTFNELLFLITSLQQEQPKGNLEYWLEHFGMPKGNIDNCITQIAQGYGACRYLEGIQHGAEAVNELAKQDQPEVVLTDNASFTKELKRFLSDTGNEKKRRGVVLPIIKHFYELGLNARKEDTK